MPGQKDLNTQNPASASMVDSAFRGVIDFFYTLGIYDVLLPFLLVYTIMFAILEKTRVFGVDRFDGKEYPRKNLNAMVAFVSGFFVVASAQLVQIITEVSANTVILLLLSVMFLMLYGSFKQETKEGVFLTGKEATIFGAVMMIGLAAIFLHAMRVGDKTWLDILYSWISGFWESTSLSAIVLLLITVGVMMWVAGSGPKEEKKEDKKLG